MHTNHATAAEVQAMREIERKVAENNGIGDRLSLGALLVEPFHADDKAIPIFRAILRDDPAVDLAKIWLAYIALHHLMDEPALRDARRSLQSIDDRSPSSGSALMLRAEIGRDLHEISPSDERDLLADSVKRQPDWTENRHRLARAYADGGRVEDAIREVRVAVANQLSTPPEDVVEKYFEICFTGRLEPRRRLDDYIRHLERRNTD
jgi:hypothetical protein